MMMNGLVGMETLWSLLFNVQLFAKIVGTRFTQKFSIVKCNDRPLSKSREELRKYKQEHKRKKKQNGNEKVKI